MLDKLKDIVPEVDENKANLIYQKNIKPKFHLNYQLALKFALFIIALVPVFIVISLGGNKASDSEFNNGDVMDNAPNMSGPSDEGINNGAADNEASSGDNLEESVYYRSDYNNGILELYFYGHYNTYYIKSYESYNIISVIIDGVKITPNEGIYTVSESTNVVVEFNPDDINDMLVFLLSVDNEIFIEQYISIK